MFMLPEIDTQEVIPGIIDFLLKSVPKGKKCIIGLSGGIDSATVAYILTTTFGKSRVIGATLPYRYELPETKEAIEDACLISDKLNILNVSTDITEMVDFYFGNICVYYISKLRIGNMMARMRMAVLYDIAAEYDGVVIGTTNKTEYMTGYFTKYGDGGVDFEPLVGLYKSYVYDVAKYLGVPDKIINKVPSANLWPGQTDEEELGITYEVLDKILYCINHDLGVVARHEFTDAVVDRVHNMIITASHKVLPIPSKSHTIMELGTEKESIL